MARIEIRQFRTISYLIIVAEDGEESEMIDKALGSKIPTKVIGEVTLADGYFEHYIRLGKL